MSSSATFSKGRMMSPLVCNLHHIGGNLDDDVKWSEVLCQFLWSGFDYDNGCHDYGDSNDEDDGDVVNDGDGDGDDDIDDDVDDDVDGDGDDDGDDDGDVTDQVSRSHYLRQWL